MTGKRRRSRRAIAREGLGRFAFGSGETRPELQHGLRVDLAHAALGDAEDLPISAKVKPS